MRKATMPPCYEQLLAYIYICFFSLLWVREIVILSHSRFDPFSHLAFGDVRIDNVVTLPCSKVKIKASKPDPFQQRVFMSLDATGRDVCFYSQLHGAQETRFRSLLIFQRNCPYSGPFCLCSVVSFGQSRIQLFSLCSP